MTYMENDDGLDSITEDTSVSSQEDNSRKRVLVNRQAIKAHNAHLKKVRVKRKISDGSRGFPLSLFLICLFRIFVVLLPFQ